MKNYDRDMDSIKNKIREAQLIEGLKNAVIIKALQQKARSILEHEIIKWKQRAKKRQYQLRDNNTKFLHTCANQRTKKNYIKLIHNLQGKL